MKPLHSCRERQILNLDKIVQRRAAAKALGEPVPLAVADTQGIVLFGAEHPRRDPAQVVRLVTL